MIVTEVSTGYEVGGVLCLVVACRALAQAVKELERGGMEAAVGLYGEGYDFVGAVGDFVAVVNWWAACAA